VFGGISVAVFIFVSMVVIVSFCSSQILWDLSLRQLIRISLGSVACFRFGGILSCFGVGVFLLVLPSVSRAPAVSFS
jgi:hypothetical protein